MGYQVEFDTSPAYELLASLNLYLFDKGLNGMKNRWTQQMDSAFRKIIGPHLTGAKQGLAAEALAILIWQCPHKKDVRTFLRWFEGLDVGELYERLNPYVKNLSRMIPSLSDWRPRAGLWLNAWYEYYFHNTENDWIESLAQHLATKTDELATVNQTEFVESVLRGIYVESVPKLKTVVLVPGFHYAPANLRMDFREMMLFVYSMSNGMLHPKAQVAADVSRMTKALSDEARLAILSNLSGDPCRFTDIAHRTGLPKSTLHNHLIHLRDAGFIRVHAHLNKTDRYSLRQRAFVELDETLQRFQAQLSREEGNSVE